MRCLTKAQLLAHIAEQLDDATATRIDDHLSSCPSCLATFVEVGKNPLIPQVDGYHVVREIGRGRFGVVYKAWRLGDHPSPVALKILSDPGDMQVSRFDREIAVLKRLESPRIVRCIDSGKCGDLIYLVMDHVSGVHLDAFNKKEQLPLEARLRVFQRICGAVGDAHVAGVIHRDLKPKNILVDNESEPHILDFGICMVEQEDWSGLISDTITHAGDIIGTLKYMSPEQAWGGGVTGHIDARTDIWSLGVMLYEIVTDGGYPYPDDRYRDRPRHEALLEQIRKDLPEQPDLSHLARGKDLETLVERCLAWERDYRISSAQELADDIGRYLNGEQITTRPLLFRHRVRRLAVGAATRSRWTFTAGFVTLVCVAIFSMMAVFDIRWQDGSGPVNADGAPPAGLEWPFEKIVVAGVGDETSDAVRDYAARHNIDGVTEEVLSWRSVHASMMQRIRQHGARALMFDYYFTADQPESDARLADAILALEDAGTPVILASLYYNDDGTPLISKTLQQKLGRRLRHGSIVAREMMRRPGEFVLAVQRGESAVIPTIALSTYAAILHPEAISEIEWNGRSDEMSLMYEVEPELYLRERDVVRLMEQFKQSEPGAGVIAGDLLGTAMFEIRKPEVWDRKTIGYEHLLNASDQELATLVAGKVIIIGDLRTEVAGGAPDRHDIELAGEKIEDVPGCYLLCDAVTGLLQRSHMKAMRQLSGRQLLLLVCVALIGCLLPIPLARLRWLDCDASRVWLWSILCTLSLTCLALMFGTRQYYWVHGGMLGFSLFAPMIGSFWVEFARNRHRVLDNRRRDFLDWAKPSSGTLTLGLKPS